MEVFISNLPAEVSSKALKEFLGAKKCFLLPGKKRAVVVVSEEKEKELFDKPITYEGSKLHFDRDLNVSKRTLVLKSPSLWKAEDVTSLLAEKEVKGQPKIVASPNEKWQLQFKKPSAMMKAYKILSKVDNVQAQLGEVAEQTRSKKAGRIIVRNLMYEAKEKHLRKLFAKIGTIREIELPKSDHPKKAHPGYAFVEFEKVDEAKKAIEEMNGKNVCGRPVKIDWAVGKEIYTSIKDATKKDTAPGGDDRGARKKESVRTVIVEEKEEDGEIGVADDLSAEVKRMKELLDEKPKEKEDEPKPKEKEEEKETKTKTKKEKKDKKRKNTEKEDGAKTKEDDEPTKKKVKKDSKKEENESDDEDEKDNEKEKKVKPGHDLEEGKTIFARNIQFDATWKDVREGFEKYGPVDRVFLVKDFGKTPTPLNGESNGKTLIPHKGTGFIKFKTKEGADKALNEEAQIKEKLRQLGLKDPLTPIEGYGVMVKGRRAIVLPPTAPEKAPLRKEAKKAEREAQKEAWSHLLRLGDINNKKHPEEWAALSKSEQMLREASRKERRFQINDPNFIVNPLRLSIRNLSVNVDEPAISKALRKNKIPSKKVILVRSKDRKDASGMRRSLGFAFAEFDDHEKALAAQRLLNNNLEIFPGGKRPLVEFAMEDKRKLHIIAKKHELQQKRLEGERAKRGEYNKENENDDNNDWTGKGNAGNNAKEVKKKKKNDREKEKKEKGRGRKQREARRQEKEQEELAAKEMEKTVLAIAKEKNKIEKKKRKAAELDTEMEQAMYSMKSKKKQKKKQKKGDELDDEFESKAMSKWRN